jgi:hypothetical protein
MFAMNFKDNIGAQTSGKAVFSLHFLSFFLASALPLQSLHAQRAPDDRNLAVLQAPSANQAQSSMRRVALVVGNGGYKDAPLNNPVNDARAIASALKASGFTVILRENADQKAMMSAVREFGDQLRGGGTGLFYFAGHGMQIKGRNYLIPIGAAIEREDEVAYGAIDAQAVLDKMEAAGNGSNIMILDACRNNPFSRSFRSGQSGLAQMDAPIGTLVSFATSPGAVASDGTGQNGLYTQHLLTAMSQPGLKVEEVFKQVRTHVRRDSQGKQVPWEATSLEGDFYFTAGQQPTPVVTTQPVQPVMPATGRENSDRRTAELLGELAKQPPIKQPIPKRQNSFGISVGDRWRYQIVDKYKNEVVNNYLFKVDALTADGGLSLNGGKQLNTANNNQISYDNTTFTRRASDSHMNTIPSQLKLGHKEDFKYTETAVLRAGGEWKQTWEGTLSVVGKERIKIPAGEFDVFRVERTANMKGQRVSGEGSPSWYGRSTMTLWISADLRNVVARDEDYRANGSSTPERIRWELTSFEVAAYAPAQR